MRGPAVRGGATVSGSLAVDPGETLRSVVATVRTANAYGNPTRVEREADLATGGVRDELIRFRSWRTPAEGLADRRRRTRQ